MKELIQNYIDWLKIKTNFQELSNGYAEITTPFVNHINDYIQIYLKKDNNNKIILSDGGDTMNNLEMEGVDFKSLSRKKELEVILNGFGVTIHENQLMTYATESTFPFRKHNLIQCILAVDDMYVLAQPRVESFFYDDVINFLNINEVRYSTNIILEGKSSFQHKFDILIPKSAKENERIIKLSYNVKKQNIIAQLFAFEDTKKKRDNEGILIINDIEKEVSPEITQAIKEYGIYEFPWSRREENKYKLVA